jgi:hypothetical protein
MVVVLLYGKSAFPMVALAFPFEQPVFENIFRFLEGSPSFASLDSSLQVGAEKAAGKWGYTRCGVQKFVGHGSI